jgi:hypothetical protein
MNLYIDLTTDETEDRHVHLFGWSDHESVVLSLSECTRYVPLWLISWCATIPPVAERSRVPVGLMVFINTLGLLCVALHKKKK